jgi:P27 family predicted phage terminase small subunit
MGKRGPAAAPTELKMIRGERKDRVNTKEPKPKAASTTDAPAWLSEEALEVWNRLAPDLIAKKVLTSWDIDSFADLCSAVVINRKAWQDINENGTTITTVARELPNGVIIFATSKNPAWQVARESTAMIVTLGGRFGLNPSDRQNLSIGSGESDPDADLLSG